MEVVFRFFSCFFFVLFRIPQNLEFSRVTSVLLIDAKWKGRRVNTYPCLEPERICQNDYPPFLYLISLTFRSINYRFLQDNCIVNPGYDFDKKNILHSTFVKFV